MDDVAQHDEPGAHGRPARTRAVDVSQQPRMMRICPAILFCVIGFAIEGLAQTRATTGDLRIVAADQSNLPLPGVRVSVVHEETGLERTAITAEDGRATASALAVGRYTMRAELDAFRPVTVDEILIELGTTLE